MRLDKKSLYSVDIMARRMINNINGHQKRLFQHYYETTAKGYKNRLIGIIRMLQKGEKL